jgi:hypothetical protein
MFFSVTKILAWQWQVYSTKPSISKEHLKGDSLGYRLTLLVKLN